MIDSNELRSAIKTAIKETCVEAQFSVNDVYYHRASLEEYPYIVFDFSNIATRTDDANKRLFYLDIDVWTRDNSFMILNFCDRLVNKFDGWRLVLDSVVCTVFYQSSGSVDDADKTLNHELLRFELQCFPRQFNESFLNEETNNDERGNAE